MRQFGEDTTVVGVGDQLKGTNCCGNASRDHHHHRTTIIHLRAVNLCEDGIRLFSALQEHWLYMCK